MDESYLSKILWIDNFLVFQTMRYVVLHSVDVLLILFWFNDCDQVRLCIKSGEWSVKKSNAVYYPHLRSAAKHYFSWIKECSQLN